LLIAAGAAAESELTGGGTPTSVAARAGAAARLATGADEAVFWTGIRGGNSTAAAWATKNGGATLETTLAQRGVQLPAWDPTSPASVAAWRNASAEFAAGASGTVRVLQTDAVRVNSVWAEVEFGALKANPNVTSIMAVNPETGMEVLLWAR
jgi:filamentous hemagglutinin